MTKCRASTHVKEKKPYNSMGMTGKKHSEQTKQLMSKQRKGENGANWRGGITPELRRARQCKEYYEWRRQVLARDNETCQHCFGASGDQKRVGHHIKSFTFYPELRYVVDNGITLCESCHKHMHKVRKPCVLN